MLITGRSDVDDHVAVEVGLLYRIVRHCQVSLYARFWNLDLVLNCYLFEEGKVGNRVPQRIRPLTVRGELKDSIDCAR